MTGPGAAAAPGADRLRLVRARGWQGRLRGLLGRRRPLGRRTGLWLAPCRAVHTIGMRYPISVAFISDAGRVLRWVPVLRPWRMASCVRAVAVVEMRVGVIDAEHGGIGRIEAAIQDAARRDVERDLQRVGQVGRNAHPHQDAGAQVDEQEDQDPGGAVDHEGPLVAPAGDAREKQGLAQAQAVPGDQHRRVPEQRGDDHVEHREDEERHAHGQHERREVVFHRRGAKAGREGIGERQEADQAGQQAHHGIGHAHDQQLAEHARELQRLGPHGGQHDAVGLDVLAGGQRHHGDRGHQRHEQQRADGRRHGGEHHQQADEHRPEEDGQGLLGEQPEAVAYPLPAVGCGEGCCLHRSRQGEEPGTERLLIIMLT
ncbi:hypothetical protein CAL27_20580 [Bordetella genomosp. 1]|uniref:DUF192 domain-containing protein n=1 Tax=Bordetella genomosp. 1 TaxID=1395607 RepID=A0ABX4EVE2_9BORD|nr:hypothetical protein CAL27_20580 [Bordetella genomosp. 1]